MLVDCQIAGICHGGQMQVHNGFGWYGSVDFIHQSLQFFCGLHRRILRIIMHNRDLLYFRIEIQADRIAVRHAQRPNNAGGSAFQNKIHKRSQRRIRPRTAVYRFGSPPRICAVLRLLKGDLRIFYFLCHRMADIFPGSTVIKSNAKWEAVFFPRFTFHIYHLGRFEALTAVC